MRNLVIFFCLGFSLSALAQTKFGVEVGVGFGNRTNIDEYIQRTEGISTIQSEIGTNVALLTKLNLSERFFLKTGAVYQTSAYSEKIAAGLFSVPQELEPYYCFLPNEAQEGRTSIKYKYNFVEIPFVVNYQFAQSCEECGWKWFVGLGPTVSWVVNKKVKSDLLKDANYIDYNCVPSNDVILGIQGAIGGEYRFSNQHFLNLSLIYDQHLQPIYYGETNTFGFYTVGLRLAYYFAFSASK
jgi:hypothetical protein